MSMRDELLKWANDALARELEVERHHRRAVEESEQALAAHVGRLRRAGDGLYHELEQWALTEQDPESVAAMKGWASETLNQTPATSLGRLKAQWQAEVLESLVPRVADEIGRTLDLSEDQIIEVEGWLGCCAELSRQAEEM